MRTTIDITLDASDVRMIQSDDDNGVVIVTKTDSSCQLDEAIVARIAELHSRRAA